MILDSKISLDLEKTKALVLGQKQEVNERLSILLTDRNLEVLSTTDPIQALSYIVQKSISVLFLSNIQLASHQSLLERVKDISPYVEIVLVIFDQDVEYIKPQNKKNKIHRFLIWKDEISVMQNNIEFVLSDLLQTFKLNQLLKIASKQSKELHDFQDSIEEKIISRTKHLEKAKQQEDEKLIKTKALIRFLKDQEYFFSMEDLFQHFKKETKKFHHLKESFLFLEKPGSEDPTSRQLIYLQNGQLHEVTGPQLKFLKEEKISEHSLREGLANLLSRPIAKLNIQNLGNLEIDSSEFHFYIINEHLMNDSDLEEFLDFLENRKMILELSLQRIFYEKEIEQTAKTWETTFDGIKNPIVIIDQNFNVLRSNVSFQKNVGDLCFKVFADRDSPCENCPVVASKKSTQNSQQQLKIGEKFYQVFSYPIVFDDQKLSQHFIVQYIDITKNQTLKMKVLQNEKIGAIGLLAGNIAHELNNPLTGIHTLVQIMQRQAEDHAEVTDQMKQDLQEVEKAALRSQVIIKNLVEFSQSDNAKKTSIVLDDVVSKTLPFLKTTMRSHNTKVTLNTAPYRIFANPHLIQQVIFNLIQNACQAMKTAGSIEIQTEFDSAKNAIVFSVKDSGSGIPEAIQDRIFDSFFTTKFEGSGTGLGLSLSKDIVEEHKGRLYFVSVSGVGTTFFMEIPVE